MSGLVGAPWVVLAQSSSGLPATSASADREVSAPINAASDVLSDEAMGSQVARVVAGMLGYTYWPVYKSERILCVLQGSRFEQILLEQVPLITSREKWKTLALNTTQIPVPANADLDPDSSVAVEAALEICDAVYYSADFANEHGLLLSSVQTRPVMTIIENSALCDEGSLFCIEAKKSKRVSFQANLDAMSLSTLRVNPQVLRMGREAP